MVNAMHHSKSGSYAIFKGCGRVKFVLGMCVNSSKVRIFIILLSGAGARELEMGDWDLGGLVGWLNDRTIAFLLTSSDACKAE